MEIYDITWSNHTSIGWEINLFKKNKKNKTSTLPSGGLSYINTNDIMKTWELLGTAASTSQEILGFIGTIQDSMPMSVQ